MSVPNRSSHRAGASIPDGSLHRATPACPECKFHCTLSADLIERLRGIRGLVSGVAVSSTNEAKVAACQVAGFYQLNEAVSLKEMWSQALPIRGTGGRTKAQRLSRQVSEIAVQNLKNLKPSSHNWTWGETLTKEDVLNLQHTDNPCVHSGYDQSLKLGAFPGWYSDTPSPPPSIAQFSMIPTSPQNKPPFTSLCFPSKIGSHRINSRKPSAAS